MTGRESMADRVPFALSGTDVSSVTRQSQSLRLGTGAAPPQQPPEAFTTGTQQQDPLAELAWCATAGGTQDASTRSALKMKGTYFMQTI